VHRKLFLFSNLSKFEEGIGEKVATFIFLESIFVSGIITALVLGWKLALISIVWIPVTFGVTMIVSWVSNTFHPTLIYYDPMTVITFSGLQNSPDKKWRRMELQEALPKKF
jgi:hypothetical protein